MLIYAIFLIILSAVLVWYISYEIPPKQIQLCLGNDNGQNFYEILGVAKQLVIQDITKEGIWATRGYDIYFMEMNSRFFKKIGRIPIPLGISTLGYFRIIRNILGKNEIVELRSLPSGNIFAFAGSFIFLSSNHGKNFLRIYEINRFGLQTGRGVMPQGIAIDKEENIFWGEYWRNPELDEINLWMSSDQGQSWNIAHTFKKGEIRHIHSVQHDQYSDWIWVTAGDEDEQCKIMYSTNKGRSFIKIGSGSQKWRAVSLLFTDEYVYWGMDGFSAEFPLPRIFRWSRKKGQTEEVATIDSLAFYSTKMQDGTFVLSTSSEIGGASIIISKDGKSWNKILSYPGQRKKPYGTIRIFSSGDKLVISCMNVTIHNNDLLVMSLENTITP